jgi:hypothetical protein
MTETASVPAVAYCGAPTLYGGACKQIVGGNGSGRCIHHDPERTEAATAMRRRGAEAANSREPGPDDVPPPPAPQTLEGVIAWHCWIAVAFATGQINKATATGLAYNLAGLRAALVSRDLEREVEELRGQVKAMRERATSAKGSHPRRDSGAGSLA